MDGAKTELNKPTQAKATKLAKANKLPVLFTEMNVKDELICPVGPNRLFVNPKLGISPLWPPSPIAQQAILFAQLKFTKGY